VVSANCSFTNIANQDIFYIVDLYLIIEKNKLLLQSLKIKPKYVFQL